MVRWLHMVVPDRTTRFETGMASILSKGFVNWLRCFRCVFLDREDFIGNFEDMFFMKPLLSI